METTDTHRRNLLEKAIKIWENTFYGVSVGLTRCYQCNYGTEYQIKKYQIKHDQTIRTQPQYLKVYLTKIEHLWHHQAPRSYPMRKPAKGAHGSIMGCKDGIKYLQYINTAVKKFIFKKNSRMDCRYSGIISWKHQYFRNYSADVSTRSATETISALKIQHLPPGLHHYEQKNSCTQKTCRHPPRPNIIKTTLAPTETQIKVV